MPNFKDNIYEGQWVVEYIEEITPFEDDIPERWLNTLVRPNTFELKSIDINEVLNDPSFKDFFDFYSPRYKYSEFDGFYVDADYNPVDFVSEETLYSPIVIVDGSIIDGYSRAAELLLAGASTIEAFVNI
jgi:hypothetical protein